MPKLKIVLTTVLILIAVSFTVLAQNTHHAAPVVDTTQVQTIPLDATTIFNLVNDQRKLAGLKPLVRDARLDASAQYKADDMTQRNYFSHYDPTNDKVMNGVQKGYELTNHNTCSYVSENIELVNVNNADLNLAAINDWMNSKPHHDAILDTRYTLTGVAVSGNKVTQHFCVTR